MVLLPQALEDTSEYVASLQLATGVPSGVDSIGHDFSKLVENKGEGDDHAIVSVDAHNSFTRLS